MVSSSGRPRYPKTSPGKWLRHKHSAGPGSPWCSAGCGPCRTPGTGSRCAGEAKQDAYTQHGTALSSKSLKVKSRPKVLSRDGTSLPKPALGACSRTPRTAVCLSEGSCAGCQPALRCASPGQQPSIEKKSRCLLSVSLINLGQELSRMLNGIFIHCQAQWRRCLHWAFKFFPC